VVSFFVVRGSALLVGFVLVSSAASCVQIEPSADGGIQQELDFEIARAPVVFTPDSRSLLVSAPSGVGVHCAR
jgi:hypothetical protein